MSGDWSPNDSSGRSQGLLCGNPLKSRAQSEGLVVGEWGCDSLFNAGNTG